MTQEKKVFPNYESCTKRHNDNIHLSRQNLDFFQVFNYDDEKMMTSRKKKADKK